MILDGVAILDRVWDKLKLTSGDTLCDYYFLNDFNLSFRSDSISLIFLL